MPAHVCESFMFLAQIDSELLMLKQLAILLNLAVYVCESTKVLYRTEYKANTLLLCLFSFLSDV